MSPDWVRLVREPVTAYEATRLSAPISAPVEVFKLLEPRAAREEQEVVFLLCLDTQRRVRELQEVSRGTLTAALMHPREVFRLAIVTGAAAIIVAHNHPSGDPTPSAEDRAVTRQLVEAGRVLDLPLYDHVILGHERYFSFAEAGLL